MSRGIIRQLKRARKAAEKDMSAATSFYGRGLASEGYSGGYRDALNDVELALNTGHGNGSSRYWPRDDEEQPK
jgi:hypothetical protein